MKKTLEEKLQMCKEHVDEGKSISHVCELHGTIDKDDKYKEMADDLFINGIMDEKEYSSVVNKKEKNRDDY